MNTISDQWKYENGHIYELFFHYDVPNVYGEYKKRKNYELSSI